METVLIISGILLFIAWLCGLIVSIPAIWRKIIGDDLKRKYRRSLHTRRKTYSGSH